MRQYSEPLGTLIDDGDESWGMVIDPTWTDEQIAEKWSNNPAWGGDPIEVHPFVRRTLHAHSAQQLRDEPQPYDAWWSEEGELKSSIVVAEYRP